MKINYELAETSFSTMESLPKPFEGLLEELHLIVSGEKDDTIALRRHCTDAKKWIEYWSMRADGYLSRHFTELMDDFNKKCVAFITGFPPKVSKKWLYKIKLCCENLYRIIVDYSLGSICKIQAFAREFESFFTPAQPLSKNSGLRNALGIDDAFEQRIDESEALKEIHECALTYEDVEKMQKETPPERSADPNKRLKILGEQQLEKLINPFNQWDIAVK